MTTKHPYVYAITVRQPWASLIAVGVKKFETRSWRPPQTLIGGHLAIHAGRAKPPRRLPLDQREAMERALGLECHAWPLLPRGKVLCMAQVVAGHLIVADDCGDRVLVENAEGIATLEVSADERRFGDVKNGSWLWQLDIMAELRPPVSVLGHQGLWHWLPGPCEFPHLI